MKNIHLGLPLPDGIPSSTEVLMKGDYFYYHYDCDKFDDRGWGCGYRTLQTLCSWVREQQLLSTGQPAAVPSLPAIQDTLVSIGDKPSSFRGSKEWIGSVEVCLVLDTLYDVASKILHVESGNRLADYFVELRDHFREKGSPVMMGGDSDAASKGILGVAGTLPNAYLLILDPHYHGPEPDQQTLVDRNMLLWRSLDSFLETSFYNLCLPQYVGKDS